MRIALIGYGGVGRAFVELIKDKEEQLSKEGIHLKLIYVLGRTGGVYDSNGINLDSFINYSSNNKNITGYPQGGNIELGFDDIIKNNDIDMLVEMTPTNKETGQPAMDYIKKSMENGYHVVTSNKGPILLAYHSLYAMAKKNNVQLGIGCTTGGALPTINGGLMDLAGSNINYIEGVLNGTTNFIIKTMEEEGLEYDEALKKAQEIGIAETDPSLDVEGWDTASKLLILTNVLMNENKTLDDISVEGITSLKASQIKQASEEDKKYKLIGKTVKNGSSIEMSVKLEKIDVSHSLFNVGGKDKAVKYNSDSLGELTMIGGASGVRAAAASILRDIINIHRGFMFVN